MNITSVGKVTDRITLLGRSESCLYLLDGTTENWLVGGSMAYVAPDIARQMTALGIDEGRITRMFILHTHFDHCGAVPFLKKRMPQAIVTASVRAGELLTRPDIAQSIAHLNNEGIARYGLAPEAQRQGFHYDRLAVEETVSDGRSMSCGDLPVQVLEVPGHSSCSMALYLPGLKALFASDAVGLYLDGKVQPTPNSNFDLYQQSLERLARYDVQALLLEHFGAFLGESAGQFIAQAIDAARRTRRTLEEAYRRTRDVKVFTEEITARLFSRPVEAILPEAVRAAVAGQIARYIAKTIEAGEAVKNSNP
ncbi:MAG: MBL fold metallo-hydrolase [Desulfatitalea sp.]|nr:MBL fold metallo-hydrolase [Desulfatitalea sp.]NNK00392.1 MBL fold metallo-hydrolase [Desulfatitalea sp.]